LGSVGSGICVEIGLYWNKIEQLALRCDFFTTFVPNEQDIMLIQFTVENFSSFKQKQVFSLLPGKGTLKPHHKSTTIQGISVLKAGLLYGANASGKSNLVRAIEFGKWLVLNGTPPGEPILDKQFRLDAAYLEKNTQLEYELQHRGKNYAYGMVLSAYRVEEEWLYELTKTKQQLIFERKNATEYDLSGLFKLNPTEKHRRFLEFLSMGTRPNQLFLTHARNTRIVEQAFNISPLLEVLDWFQNSLTVVYPSSRSTGKKMEFFRDNELRQVFEKVLQYFDTGISGLELIEVAFDKVEVPAGIKQEIKSVLLSSTSEATSVLLSNEAQEVYYLVSKKEGEENQLKAEKLLSRHSVMGGSEALFELQDESDGTRRIMDLVPLLIDFFAGGNVLVVDEIERSLHPNLVKDLLDFILSNCEGIDSQLILASHESTLMTQQLLRKDEIWFVVKNSEGASQLHSLEEYKVRFDKEIMRDYLLGRYKGVPRFRGREHLSVLTRKGENTNAEATASIH
jgi:AAA15 family ATPase/GTPase